MKALRIVLWLLTMAVILQIISIILIICAQRGG